MVGGVRVQLVQCARAGQLRGVRVAVGGVRAADGRWWLRVGRERGGDDAGTVRRRQRGRLRERLVLVWRGWQLLRRRRYLLRLLRRLLMLLHGLLSGLLRGWLLLWRLCLAVRTLLRRRAAVRRLRRRRLRRTGQR